MNTRKKFLLQSGFAATALLTAKPFKSFAKFDSRFSNHGESKTITIVHSFDTANTMYAGTPAFQKSIAALLEIKKDNNCLLLDTGSAVSVGSGLQGDAMLTGIAQYKILFRNDLKIGIISTNGISNAELINHITATATLLKENQHCDLVICLSDLTHSNKKSVNNSQLAVESKNLDMILGGLRISDADQAAAVLLNKSKQEVVLNYAGHGNTIFGRIDIAFDNAGNKKSFRLKNLVKIPLKEKLKIANA